MKIVVIYSGFSREVDTFLAEKLGASGDSGFGFGLRDIAYQTDLAKDEINTVLAEAQQRFNLEEISYVEGEQTMNMKLTLAGALVALATGAAAEGMTYEEAANYAPACYARGLLNETVTHMAYGKYGLADPDEVHHLVQEAPEDEMRDRCFQIMLDIDSSEGISAMGDAEYAARFIDPTPGMIDRHRADLAAAFLRLAFLTKCMEMGTPGLETLFVEPVDRAVDARANLPDDFDIVELWQGIYDRPLSVSCDVVERQAQEYQDGVNAFLQELNQ